MTAAPNSPAVTREDERLAEKFKGLWGSFAERLPVEDLAYALATARLAASTPGAEGLRPMAEAPRGEYVLARYRQNTEERTEHWSGRWFVIRHEGKVDDFDLGWALFPGYGGVSDRQFDGWLPLPFGSPAAVQRGEVAREALHHVRMQLDGLEGRTKGDRIRLYELRNFILSALSRDGGKA